MLSLSVYSKHLEVDAEMLSLSLKYLTCFIKKHSLKDILLINSLLFWELALMSETCSRLFLKLGGIALKFYLNLMLPLL